MPGLNKEKNEQNQHQIVLRACSSVSCEPHQTPCSRKTCWINWTLKNPHQRPGAVGIVHAHSLTASVRKAETQMWGRSTPRTKRTQHGLFASDSNDLQIWIIRVRSYSHNSQKLCHTTIYSHTENVYKALHNKAEDVCVCIWFMNRSCGISYNITDISYIELGVYPLTSNFPVWHFISTSIVWMKIHLPLHKSAMFLLKRAL